MKKLFVMLAILALSMNLMAGELVIKAGIDINSDTKGENSLGLEEKGYSSNTLHVDVEGYGQLGDAVYLGAGIEFPSKLKIEDAVCVTIVPVYLAAKIKSQQSGVKPYIGAKIGAAVPFYEDDSFDEYSAAGLFLGVNAGLEFENNLMLEIFYEQSNYGITSLTLIDEDGGNLYYDQNLDLTTPKVGVNVGYKFDL